jgi:hypothetical protein
VFEGGEVIEYEGDTLIRKGPAIPAKYVRLVDPDADVS